MCPADPAPWVHQVRPMVASDVGPVAGMLARAFYDDPLQVWAFPDPETRLPRLQALFALELPHASLPFGESYTDVNYASAAQWAPPGRLDPDPEHIAAMQGMADIVGDALPRFRAAFDLMRSAHPAEPHFYLQGVGTDPPLQGRGFAKAVLAPVLERCDADGTPAYLESTKERNVAFYEKLGWRVTQTLQVPDGGPSLWCMWRG